MIIFYCLLAAYLISVVVHATIRSKDVEPKYPKYEKFREICVSNGFLPFDYVKKEVDYLQKMDKNGNTLFVDTHTGYIVLETEKEIKIIDKI
jgi:hypothetical protein